MFTPNTLERITGTAQAGGMVYLLSGLLLTIAAGPLAFFLPFCPAALIFTWLLLATLNVSSLSTVGSTQKKLYLQSLNLAALAATVHLVRSDSGLSIGVRTSLVGLILAGLASLIYYSVPPGVMKRCAPVQQLVLAAILISWLLIHEEKLASSPQLASLQHFRMGLRAIFLGPLGMFAVVFISSIFGWNRILVGLAGICFGQYAIGLIELGVQLDSKFLMVAALISTVAFLLLLGATILSKNW